MTEVILSKVFQFIRNGLSIKQSDDAEGIPITRIETISDRFVDTTKCGYANLNEVNLGKKNEYFLNNGDILMSNINSPSHLGKAAIYEGQGNSLIHGMNLLCFRPKEDALDPKFAHYYFLTNKFLSEIQQISNQSVNQASFAVSKVKKLKIPLPPLSTQKKIAATLDAADAHYQKTKQLLAKYDELAQSIFFEMFGDPVTNPKGLLIEELGVVLPEKNSIKCGPFGSQLKIGEFVERGIPVYGIDNVQVNKFIDAKPKFITDKKYSELKAFDVKFNDILISRTGTVGRTCLAPEIDKAVIGPNLLKVRIQNETLLPEFLAFAFNYSASIKRQIELCSPGATVAVYNTGNLKKLKIPVPSLANQEKFVKSIKSILSQTNSLNNSIVKSENLFNCLLQKAFKGELIK